MANRFFLCFEQAIGNIYKSARGLPTNTGMDLRPQIK